jgi:D-alanine-D-alanine ligase
MKQVESTDVLKTRIMRDAAILIIYGGLSHEREVSLSSGRRVQGHLKEAGWKVETHDLDAHLIDYLNDPATRPDLVWPLLHGANGEDGSIRDILEMTGLSYIGSRANASRTAWNKPIAKNIIRKAGLSTPHSVTLPESIFRELGANKVVDLLVHSLDLPLFIKPSYGGSALGCSMVETADQLPKALIDCFAYGPIALVEHAITGIEVSVSVVEIEGQLQTLPPLEIWTPDNIYNYEARVTSGPTKFYIPARLDADQLETIRKAALIAHEALGLRDISRSDFIVDSNGIPQFLESNVAPGMTATSQLPQSAVAAGFRLPDFYSSLVESVLSQKRM